MVVPARYNRPWTIDGLLRQEFEEALAILKLVDHWEETNPSRQKARMARAASLYCIYHMVFAGEGAADAVTWRRAGQRCT